jgi:hypothetical protein
MLALSTLLRRLPCSLILLSVFMVALHAVAYENAFARPDRTGAFGLGVLPPASQYAFDSPTFLSDSSTIERLPPVTPLAAKAREANVVFDPAILATSGTMPLYDEQPSHGMFDLRPGCDPNSCHFQVLPVGLLYTSYLASVREPRIACQWMGDRTQGAIWDVALGGRVAIMRWGTSNPRNLQGTEIQLEGAGLPQLSAAEEMDLMACDYRFGIPVAFAHGRHHYKVGYYHISSHLGDEWMIRYPSLVRINYARDAMVVGYSFYPVPAWRFYVEGAYAFGAGECTEPWEFQFGIDYSPAEPTGIRPVPFMAINAHLREENDFGGNVNFQVGWQWRGVTGNLLRMGMQCYVGQAQQYEFWDQYESKLGFGIWYDF